MKVQISYKDFRPLSQEEKDILDYWRADGSPSDEIELDSVFDIFDISERLGCGLTVGYTHLMFGDVASIRTPHAVIINPVDEHQAPSRDASDRLPF